MMHVLNLSGIPKGALEKFGQALTKEGRSRGVQLTFLPTSEWQEAREREEEIEDAVKEAAERLEKACQREKVHGKCLLVIMNNNNRSYGTVKYYGDLKCKLTTQCATQERLIKEAKGDYAGNLVLKINTKVRAAAVYACGFGQLC